MVEGDLLDLSMPSLLYALSTDRTTAVLTVQRGTERGALYFSDGTLVHALSGAAIGDQAVRQLLRWPDGRFRVVRERVVQPRTITQPVASFLGSGPAPAPSSAAAPRAAATGSDPALFGALLELLTRLEQDRARLSEGRIEHGADGRLTALAAIVNGVIAFVAERRRDADVLPDRVLARMAETQPYAQMLGGDGERISIAAVAAALQNWTGHVAERQRMEQLVVDALVDVLVEYFTIAGALFHAATEREEWRMTSEVFIDDLRTTVRTGENDTKGEGYGEEVRARGR